MTEIHERLQELKELGLYRRMRMISGPQGPRVVLDGKPVLLLCSNNYLGLADHPRVREAAADAAMRWGVGAGASRLVSGTMTVHRRLEERLAEFKRTRGRAAVRLGLPGQHRRDHDAGRASGEVVFSDELNHASIIDGCRLARAETFVYRHARRRAPGLGHAPGRGPRRADRHRLRLLDGRRRRAAGRDRRAGAAATACASRSTRPTAPAAWARAGAARWPRPAWRTRSTSSSAR